MPHGGDRCASRVAKPRKTRHDRRSARVLHGRGDRAAYPLNVACIVVGALAVMRLVYAQPTAEFVASCEKVITWGDLAFGATTTAAYALLATLLLPRLLRVVAASRRGLVVKLVATWLAVQASFFVIEAGAVAAWPAAFSPGASSSSQGEFDAVAGVKVGVRT
jgi:hypothetical protein